MGPFSLAKLCATAGAAASAGNNAVKVPTASKAKRLIDLSGPVAAMLFLSWHTRETLQDAPRVTPS